MIAQSVQVQPRIDELLLMLKRAKYENEQKDKEIYRLQKAGQRDHAWAECLRHIIAINKAPTKFFDAGDKLTCAAILIQLFLKRNEQRGIFTRIETVEIKRYNGNLARTDRHIQNLLDAGLFVEDASEEHTDGEYWLAPSDDYFDRIINPQHKARGWKAATVWCDTCGKMERTQAVGIGVTILICRKGHVITDSEPKVQTSIISEKGVVHNPFNIPMTDEVKATLVALYENRTLKVKGKS